MVKNGAQLKGSTERINSDKEEKLPCILLAGSYFARMLSRPISRKLGKAEEVFAFVDEDDTARSYIDKFTQSVLKKSKSVKADYLVFEIQGVLELLYSSEKNRMNIEAGFFDGLIDGLNRSFEDGRIILIKSNRAERYISFEGRTAPVPRDFIVKRSHVEMLNALEDHIISGVNGVKIDMGDAYRYIKRYGYALNEKTFEEECYIDVANAVSDYILCGIRPDEDEGYFREPQHLSYRQLISEWKRCLLTKYRNRYIVNAGKGAEPEEPSLGKTIGFNNQIPLRPQPYYNNEVSRVIKEVNRLTRGGSALCFVCVTDIHYTSHKKASQFPFDKTFERMIANMHAVIDKIQCDFIINLGDDTDGNYTNIRELEQTEEFLNRSMLGLGKTYYRAIGNHDTNCYGKLIDVEYMSKLYCSHIQRYGNVVFNPESEGTEYYVDCEETNIRMLVLNTMFGKPFCYSESTGNWLREDALKTDRTILLCEHLSAIHTMNMNAKPLENRDSVIKALKDFDGTIIQICGHSHCDYSFTDGDEQYSPWLTVFSNLQRCSRRRQSDIGDITVGHTDNKFSCPRRNGWTTSEDCWDVVVIRPELGKINFVRFGAGDDREFDIKVNRSE